MIYQGFSKIANTLSKLLKKKRKFMFDDECMNPFKCLKRTLVVVPIFIALDWSKPSEVMFNASGVAVGVSLMQINEKLFHPIYYASRALNGAQKNYSVIEK